MRNIQEKRSSTYYVSIKSRGELIEKIQKSRNHYDGLIVNAGGTHIPL